MDAEKQEKRKVGGKMKSASVEIMRTKEVESGRSLGRWIGGSANQRISKSGKPGWKRTSLYKEQPNSCVSNFQPCSNLLGGRVINDISGVIKRIQSS